MSMNTVTDAADAWWFGPKEKPVDSTDSALIKEARAAFDGDDMTRMRWVIRKLCAVLEKVDASIWRDDALFFMNGKEGSGAYLKIGFATQEQASQAHMALASLRNRFESIVPAVAIPQPSEGWRPIESAPTPDRGAFLAWCPERKNIYEVVRNRWKELERPFAHFGPGADPLREDATLWQPLPSPPVEEAK